MFAMFSEKKTKSDMQKANHFYFLILMIFLFVINSNASNIKSVFIGYEQFVIEPDTIIVYDTIYTYDTVFTYQTIHDTVFYYDSLFVDEIEKMKKIEHKKGVCL